MSLDRPIPDRLPTNVVEVMQSHLRLAIYYAQRMCAERNRPYRSQATQVRNQMNELGAYFDWLEEYAIEDLGDVLGPRRK